MPGAYKTIKDTSLIAQFKMINNEKSKKVFLKKEEIYFLAWTTTPWTLPANNGLAVGKKINYVLIETFNKYLEHRIKVIIAEKCIDKFFNSDNEVKKEDILFNKQNVQYKIIKKIKGSDLLGLDYDQLMPYVKVEKPAFTVVEGDFVSTDEGTGIVHISLTFGSDDFMVSKKNKLPGVFIKDKNGNSVPIVNKAGKFVDEIIDFAGMEVKSFSDKKNKEDWTIPKRNVNIKKDKDKCDFIWIIWEIIFEELKCRDDKLLKTIIKVLYSLFIHEYTSGKRTERMFIIYNSIGHLTNKIDYKKDIRLNEVLYIQTQSNINKMYEIMKNI